MFDKSLFKKFNYYNTRVSSKIFSKLLDIKNLTVNITNNEKKILKNFNLSIRSGEIHVIMGKNGSGKSTLSKVIVGHPSYDINNGFINYKTHSLNNISANFRSLEGIFLCFQNPVEITGVKNLDFIRKISNTRRKYLNKKPLDPLDFYIFINEKLSNLNLDASFLSRNVNDGFSGGEKKRNEMLQLITLEPDLCIFDEIDSGLDVDSIKDLTSMIKELKKKGTGILIITHYKKLLDQINPDYIHVLRDGKIIKTGGIEIAEFIEKEGFDSISIF